jgi:hypothetical protein
MQYQLNILKGNQTLDLEVRLDSASNLYTYMNNGAEKIKDFFSEVPADTLTTTLNANEVMRKLTKQSAYVFYISKPMPKKIISTWALLAGLGGLILGYLIAKLMNKKTNKIKTKEDFINAFDTLGDFAKDTDKNGVEKKMNFQDIFELVSEKYKGYEQIEAERNSANIALTHSKEQLEKTTTQNQSLSQKVNTLEQQLTSHQEFISAIQVKYLNTLEKAFGSGIESYPLTDEKKKIFTEIVYSIALHVISYCTKTKSAYDSQNVASLVQNQIQNYKGEVSLSHIDTQKFNALILFIAEELKRNHVSELKQVNYTGYGFTK